MATTSRTRVSFAALAAASAMFLSACAVGVSTHEYPPEAREAFVSACSAQGAYTTACEACFNAVQAEFTYEEFQEVDEGIENNNLDPALQERYESVLDHC